MGEWKTLRSPKLGVPLELREVTAGGVRGRVWEVQELRKGCMFKVTLPDQAESEFGVALAGRLGDDALQHAVCLAVEDALLSEPDKEPGETYDVRVSGEHLDEASQVLH